MHKIPPHNLIIKNLFVVILVPILLLENER